MSLQNVVNGLLGKMSDADREKVADNVEKGNFNDAVSTVLNVGSNIFPSMLTIPLILAASIVVAITVATTLKRSYDEMKELNPNAEVPPTSRAIFYGILWGVIYFALFFVLNIVTGGAAGIVSVISILLMTVFYFTTKSLGWGVKDLKDGLDIKVKASKWSYLCGSLIAAMVIGIVVCITYAIVSYRVKKNLGDKLAPVLVGYIKSAIGLPAI